MLSPHVLWDSRPNFLVRRPGSDTTLTLAFKASSARACWLRRLAAFGIHRFRAQEVIAAWVCSPLPRPVQYWTTDMSPTWFGLSHDRAWGDVGQSFSDLTSCEGCQKRCLPTQQSAVSAAGFRSKPKGAGSFQLQVGVNMLRLSVSGRRLNLLVVFRPSGV